MINPGETNIKGRWVKKGEKLVQDENAKRINELIKSVLIKVTSTNGGWEVLYKNPADGEFWELTYPESSSQGGGPPELSKIRRDAAKSKYNFTDLS